jgi:hypothetical protein
MDLTTLYRVLYKPSDVFKELKDRIRPEPYIFICVVVLLPVLIAYRNDYKLVVEQPFLIPLGLLQGFFFCLTVSQHCGFRYHSERQITI